MSPNRGGKGRRIRRRAWLLSLTLSTAVTGVFLYHNRVAPAATLGKIAPTEHRSAAPSSSHPLGETLVSKPAREALGHLYSGDMVAAETAFARAALADPADPSAQYGLALVAWWRALLTDGARPLIEECERHIDATLDAARSIERTQPARADFFAGRAYGTRGLVRALQRRWVAAVRDAKRMRSALEDAIEQDPTLTDAYTGLGMYDAAVDKAPGSVKVAGFFLFIPSGDTERGLAALQRAAAGDGPFQPEALLFLAAAQYGLINEPSAALATLQRLRDRYPDNAFVPALQAYVHLEAFGDAVRASRAATAAAAADDGTDPYGGWPIRFQSAVANFRAGRIPEAVAALDSLDTVPPEHFASVRVRALLLHEQLAFQLGDRETALAIRDRVVGNPQWSEFHGSAEAEAARPRGRREADIFRANLEGRRLLVAGRQDAARAAFERVLDRFPGNPQTRYRVGELELQARNYEQAATVFTSLAREAPVTPTWLAPWAWVKAGWAHDSLGRRERAEQAYERAFEYRQRYDDLAVRAAERFLDTPYRPADPQAAGGPR